MMLKSDLKREGGFWSFTVLLATAFILLSQFADPVIAASSSSSSLTSSATLPRRVVLHKHTERLKKSATPSVSLSLRRREWKPLSAALNSSRNARQVPEIPALYSAPQIQTPEIPALYSAPQINSDGEQQDEDIQNEVDSQGRATTEITIGDDDEEEDETSSEDYQYGVPTEKSQMSDDSNQNEPNDYPTDSPLPQATYLPPVSKTNDVEFDDDQQPNADDETTEDSAGGYNDEPSAQYGPPSNINNGNNQPSSQYGPPNNNNNGNSQPSTQYGPPRSNDNNEPSPQYGPPQAANGRKNGNGDGNGAKKRKMQSSSSSSPNPVSRTNNSNSNNNRRPSDQQQIENSLQPMTRQHEGNPTSDSGLQPGYLPPVYQPPSSVAPSQQQQQQQPQDGTSHQNQRQQQEKEVQQGKQQETYSNSYGSNHADVYEQQPPNSNYHTLPQNQQQGSTPSQQQRQQQQQRPLQDLSQEVGSPSQSQGQNFGKSQHQSQPNSFYGPPGGVNHFHQSQNQRQPSNGNGEEDELEGLNENIVDAELLERVQQIIEDHERQQKVILDKIQKDNEKALFPSTGASGISSPFSGNELSSGNSNDRNNNFSPQTFYGPPPSSLNNNGYSNPNSAQQPAPAYLPPRSPSRQNPTAGGYTNSQPSNNYRGGKERDSSSSSSTTKLSPDVQVQKAVLSRHFTETEPGPAPAYSNTNNNNNNNKNNADRNRETGYANNNNQQNQLNSVAGPGEEYLPPPPPPSSTPAQQQQQNSGYSNSFQSDSPREHQQQQQPHQDFSVKLGTGITVGDNAGSKSTSGDSPNPYSSASIAYGPPALSSSSTISQDSRESRARQNGGSPSPSALERFPSQSPRQYHAPSQQQQNFPSSEFWSRTNQPASPSGSPQPRYGPPSSTYPSNSATALGNDNGNSRGGAPYQSPNGPSDNAVVNGNHGSGDGGNNYNQRSSYQAQQPQQQYLPPSSSSANNDNHDMTIAVPRPVYGVPLAPVITLDSDNNLHHFNGNNNNPSYSPDASKFATSFPSSNAGTSTTGPTSNYYLPPPDPSKLSSSPSSQQVGLGQFHQLNSLNSPQQTESPGVTPSTNTNHYDTSPSYGFVSANNNPSSSSSSAYLMFQGHDGNSNNHIYNINHNGYDDTSSGSSSRSIVIFAQQHPLDNIHGSAGSSSANPSEPDYHHDDQRSSSIIIPGISNTFSLPIYDYSPSHQNLHHDELLGAAATPVGLPFEQLLQQQQLPPNILTLPSSSSASAFPENLQPIFYDGGATRRQDNFRVSRRALSRKARVSPASNRKSSISSSANQKLSTTTQKTTTTSRNGSKKIIIMAAAKMVDREEIEIMAISNQNNLGARKYHVVV